VTIWDFWVVIGFVVLLFAAPVAVMMHHAHKEREAEFAAGFEVVSRKFRLRLLSDDERRETLIDLLVGRGDTLQGARRKAALWQEFSDIIFERVKAEDPSLTREQFDHPDVSSLDYEIDHLVGRFLHGEIARQEMPAKMIEIYKDNGLRGTAARSALDEWNKYEPIWTHKSYVHIPLPPPKAPDVQS
jgi:hypothetical protein